MKTYKILLLVFLVSIFQLSCIDIIEIDLEDAEPRIVIEANLNATDSTCSVIATYSNSFYDNNKPQRIENLDIILIKNNNENYYFEKNTKGEFISNGIIAESGDLFQIEITDKNTGVKYTATAQTPSNPGLFLTLFTSFTDEDIYITDSLGNERMMLFALTYWFDIPDEENYYRIKVYKDAGRKYINDSYNFTSDEFAIGDTMQIVLSEYFLEGDTVKIELASINKETYDYFDQFIEVLYSGGSSTSPFNPKGNFDNDALGYFCVEQTSSFEYIVYKFPFF